MSHKLILPALLTLAACGVGEKFPQVTGTAPLTTAPPVTVCSVHGPFAFGPGTWVPETTNVNSLWRSPPQELCSFPLTSGVHTIDAKLTVAAPWPVDTDMGVAFFTDLSTPPNLTTVNTTAGLTYEVNVSGSFAFTDAAANPLTSGTVSIAPEFDCTGNGGAPPCASNVMTLTVTVQ